MCSLAPLSLCIFFFWFDTIKLGTSIVVGLSRSVKFCYSLPRSPNPTPKLEPEPGVYEAHIDAAARRMVETRIETVNI